MIGYGQPAPVRVGSAESAQSPRNRLRKNAAKAGGSATGQHFSVEGLDRAIVAEEV
jgi:hypothetical protein